MAAGSKTAKLYILTSAPDFRVIYKWDQWNTLKHWKKKPSIKALSEIKIKDEYEKIMVLKSTQSLFIELLYSHSGYLWLMTHKNTHTYVPWRLRRVKVRDASLREVRMFSSPADVTVGFPEMFRLPRVRQEDRHLNVQIVKQRNESTHVTDDKSNHWNLWFCENWVHHTRWLSCFVRTRHWLLFLCIAQLTSLSLT